MKKTLFTLSILGSILGFAQEAKDNKETKEKEIEGVVITKTKKQLSKKPTVPFLIFLSSQV